MTAWAPDDQGRGGIPSPNNRQPVSGHSPVRARFTEIAIRRLSPLTPSSKGWDRALGTDRHGLGTS